MTYNEILQYKLSTNKTFIDLVKRWQGLDSFDPTQLSNDMFLNLLDNLVNYNRIFGTDQNHFSIDFVIDYINYKLFAKICCRLFIRKFQTSPYCTITKKDYDGIDRTYALAADGFGIYNSNLDNNSTDIEFTFVEETFKQHKSYFPFRAFFEEPTPAGFKNCELLDHTLEFKWSTDQWKGVKVRLRDFNKNMFQELLDGVRK